MIKDFFKFLLNECLYCGNSTSEIICIECSSLLEFWKECWQCENHCQCYIKSFIPFIYNNVIQKLILDFKHGGKTFLSEFFAKEIAGLVQMHRNIILVPIPTTRKTLWQRGYNQTILLAVSLQKIWKCKISPFVLTKITETQKNKTFEERQKIEMLINENTIINKDVVIIDDVISSGGTIKKAISLIEPFANNITICAIARVMENKRKN